MLSSGPFHLAVPRDRLENLAYRRELIALADESHLNRRLLLEACRRDCLFYVNAFVWQFNPNKFGGEVGPFATWPFQDELIPEVIDCIEGGRDLPVEKSREVGLSWIVLFVFDWLARFHRNKNFIVISHSEDAVDRPADPNSLMWKLGFMNDRLPAWMPKFTKTKMAISYPATNSFINGAANTTRAGVGGRANAILLDEFAKQPNATAILSYTADTSKCRIIVSTHYGVGTEFNRIVNNPMVKKAVVHWSKHPEKAAGAYRFDPQTRRVQVLDADYQYPPEYPFVREALPAGGPCPGLRSPWYDAECRRPGRTQRDVAMHLDIDPQGSAHQVFDAIQINRLREQFACEPDWQGDVLYDPDTGDFVGLRRLSGGPLKFWFDPDAYNCGPPRWNADTPLYYAAGGDLSLGTGATPSCFSFADSLGNRVGEYKTRTIDPKSLAAVIVALCNFFKAFDGRTAKLNWEANGPGVTFGDEVMALGYSNLSYRSKRGPGTRSREEDPERPGWHSTPPTKKLAIEAYAWALSHNLYVNRSDEALAECLSFEYTSRGIEHGAERQEDRPAETGVNHGDMVMADALCYMAISPLLHSVSPGVKREQEAPFGSIAHRRSMARSNRTRFGEVQWS